MSKAVGIFSGILFVRTRYYDDVKKVVVLQGNKPEKRFFEERPQGKWIKGREISRTMLGDKVEHIDYRDYTCSNCGLVLDNLLYRHDGSPFYKFCPNCGADMQKGSTESLDYQRAVEDAEYCERYEPTYNPNDGSM